jgi:hypothetical protein
MNESIICNNLQQSTTALLLGRFTKKKTQDLLNKINNKQTNQQEQLTATQI